MFLAFSTLGLPRATWPEAAALARAHGFQGVELRALRGSIDLPAMLREEFGDPEAMAREMRASGVRVASLDSSMRLLGTTDEHRREVAELAAWADAAAVPYLRVFDGGETGAGADPSVRAEMVRELDRWAETRARHGFRCDLMVETHWALTDPIDCLRLAEESGGRLHLLWDVCHTWKPRDIAPAEDWPALRPIVRHIHIKDARRNAASGHGVDHVLPGTGELDVPALLEALARDGFEGPVSLEWESFWNPQMPSLAEALAAGHAHGWW